MRIEIKHDLDADGLTPIVLVPLVNSTQRVVLYETDFDALIEKGLYPLWRLSSGKVLERGSQIAVARLVVDAKAGEKIYLKDGDPCNLRRTNIFKAAGGNSTESARDKRSNEHRPHYRSNLQLKHIYNEVPWHSELR
jgi:hypothetical protein